MDSSSLFDLRGKVAVVTGSCGALGGVMAEALVKNDVFVVITGRKQESVDEAVARHETAKDKVLGIPADVTKEEDLENLCKLTVEKWGKIDILVNAAGGNMPGATIPPDGSFFQDTKIADLKRVMDINFIGTVLPCLIIGKELAKQPGSTIINISSMAAEQATISRVMGYSASKAAVSNFTRWLSVELSKGSTAVRVNAIAPGFFIGQQNKALLLKEDGTLTERGESIIRKTPLKRFGHAEELIGVLLFLCSRGSQFITGTVIPVDGGFSAFSGV